MECLFEILIPLLGEFFVGAGFELVAEGIGRFIGWVFRILCVAADFGIDFGSSWDDSPAARQRADNVGRALLWALGGAAAGFVSLAILPHPLVRAPILQAVNLVLTPLAMAAAMVWATRLLKDQRAADQHRTPLSHFACAYAFALCYLLVRFVFARP